MRRLELGFIVLDDHDVAAVCHALGKHPELVTDAELALWVKRYGALQLDAVSGLMQQAAPVPIA
jgi:hypothetical protein